MKLTTLLCVVVWYKEASRVKCMVNGDFTIEQDVFLVCVEKTSVSAAVLHSKRQ